MVFARATALEIVLVTEEVGLKTTFPDAGSIISISVSFWSSCLVPLLLRMKSGAKHTEAKPEKKRHLGFSEANEPSLDSRFERTIRLQLFKTGNRPVKQGRKASVASIMEVFIFIGSSILL